MYIALSQRVYEVIQYGAKQCWEKFSDFLGKKRRDPASLPNKKQTP